MIDLRQRLQDVFGFADFREGQESCITQLVDGHSSLAVFPTGSGKSLCYQLAALELPHLTLVVSPLLALIKDQLDFLKSKGIAAASIDSSLSPDQYQQVVADLRGGHLKILMVSVERFKNERFRQLISQTPISMLVVDEAHCISEWGHNFRPDYLNLPFYRDQLRISTVLLLTATATAKVKRDMASKFRIKAEHIVQTGFYRANLELDIRAVPSVEKMDALFDAIKMSNGPGIVYVTLQKTAENVAEGLVRRGILAEAYHAGLDSEVRTDIQNRFMTDQLNVVVATIAFGMGVDKSNIRSVIHYDLPKSIENYSQEIGRAGRDGLRSQCVLLGNLDGINTVENFIYGDTPELSSIQTVLTLIRNHSVHGGWEVMLSQLSTDANIRTLTLKTLLVQLELRGVLEPLYSYYAEYKFRYLKPVEEILSLFNDKRRAFLQTIFNQGVSKRIWVELDVQKATELTGGNRKRVTAALEYLHEQQVIELHTQKMTEVYRIDEQKLRDDGLGAELGEYFLEKERSEIARVGAMIRFFHLDRCLSSNLARYFDDQDSPDACGHCSVCLGQVAELPRSSLPAWPGLDRLRKDVKVFRAHIEAKAKERNDTLTISVGLIARFLAGISVPAFARYRVRALAGFASCEAFRMSEIVELIEKERL